jgi:outer membrane protein assembly factor BamB
MTTTNLYFADGKGRSCHDASANALATALRTGRIWSSPVVDADRVYVASQDHHLYAINRLGNQVWRFRPTVPTSTRW